jgi:hypothetical protein
MYNSNQGGNPNSNFHNGNNSSSNTSKTLVYLRILAGCIGGLSILKLIAGDYNGFNSDLITSLFIFLTTYCVNGFLAGFLVISLLFSAIITGVFFGLQLQNYLFDIPNIILKNTLIFLYIIHSLGLILYSFAIYYCYKFYSDCMNSSGFNPAGYSLINDNPATQQRAYGSVDNERHQPNSNFSAFEGTGVRLDA